MDTLSLLIADGNEDFRLSLSRALQGMYDVRCCQNGEDALRLIRQEAPDILILDLMLSELDGLSLLHTLVETGISPMVLATSCFINQYISEKAEELGVGYLLQKPCNIRATVDRIRDLSHRLHRSEAAAPDSRTRVSNMLITLGISTKLHGYAYLREAILMMAETPMQSITKELYPAVGELCGANAKQVERSIRSAVDAAWKGRDDRIWRQFFQVDSDGTVKHPSNAAFISQLADRLQLDQMRISLP